MRLYRTIDYYEEPTLIGIYDKTQDCHKAMIADIESRNEKSYYSRYWVDNDNRTIIDYGSHVMFYVITGEDNKL